MGTQSLTVIQDIDGDEICVMHRFYDGRPSMLGDSLKRFAGTKTITAPPTDQASLEPENMNRFAAMLIGHFKDHVFAGGTYLHAAMTRGIGEDYIYLLKPNAGGQIILRIASGETRAFGVLSDRDNMGIIYDGLLSDFDPDQVEAAERQLKEPE